MTMLPVASADPLSPTLEAWSWQRRGRCLDYPAEVFFPEDGTRKGLRRREERAKRICRQCPVLQACREHALRTPERYGVWGAMSPGERIRSTGRERRRPADRENFDRADSIHVQ